MPWRRARRWQVWPWRVPERVPVPVPELGRAPVRVRVRVLAQVRVRVPPSSRWRMTPRKSARARVLMAPPHSIRAQQRHLSSWVRVPTLE